MVLVENTNSLSLPLKLVVADTPSFLPGLRHAVASPFEYTFVHPRGSRIDSQVTLAL